MALTALAAYSDSDESGEEETARSKNIAPINPALQSKQEIRRLVPVVAAKRGRTSSSVKIGLPVIETGENDSDDEEHVSLPKRPKGKSGLVAFLPEPKRTPSFKGAKFAKPLKATALIPDALRRKKPPPSLAQQRAAAAARKDKRKDGQGSEDEESGDDDTPFFSNLDSSKTDSSSYTTAALTSSSEASPSAPLSVELPLPSLPLISQPPLIRTDTSSASTSDHYDNTQAQYYSEAVPEHDPPLPTVHETNPTAVYSSEDQALDEAAFRRLAGGSRKGHRKKEEEISLEQMVDIQEEENKMKGKYDTVEHSYTSGTVPAHLAYDHTQKRKHQIHWLANQAKTKEIELKNFWSQAAHSRKQSRSKYGF